MPQRSSRKRGRGTRGRGILRNLEQLESDHSSDSNLSLEILRPVSNLSNEEFPEVRGIPEVSSTPIP